MNSSHRNTTNRINEPSLSLPSVSMWSKFSVGVCTGAISCCLTTPMDMLRTQIQKQGTTIDGSIVHAFKRVVSTYGGVRSLYGSFFMRLCRSSWYSMVTLL